MTVALDVLRGLALDHRIGGVLVFDLDAEALHPLGAWLAGAVGAATGTQARVVTLGPWITEDELWTRLRLAEGRSATTGPGLLVEESAGPPLVVLVPDLAEAGLFVFRAAVTLLDAEVATRATHGVTSTWAPQGRWLAACSRTDAAHLSAHLLDRFPVRCDGAELRPFLARAAANPGRGLAEFLPPPDIAPVTRARFTPDAVDEVLALSPAAPGARRDLALARMGRIVASRRGSVAVTREDVQQAALLLGLAAQPEAPVPPSTTRPVPAERPLPEERFEEALPDVLSEPIEGAPAGGMVVSAPAARLDSAATAVILEGVAPGGQYPEDIQDPVTPRDELGLPAARRSAQRRGRGDIIGVEPTTTLFDFACMATLLEAFKHQASRRTVRRAEPGRLILYGSDLRRYRRRPEPTTALVLVLDHTCRYDWDWTPALAAYLRWAYTSRAAVAVVEFGYRGAENRLRAARYRSRTIRTARLIDSLGRQPGLASPLAHAMDLALDELRRVTRRRRTPIAETLLVVVTDGRGNVPYDASARGELVGSVGRQGVDDAVATAAPICGLQRVRAFVLTPDVACYPELPFNLADAIGAVVLAPDPYGAEP